MRQPSPPPEPGSPIALLASWRTLRVARCSLLAWPFPGVPQRLSRPHSRLTALSWAFASPMRPSESWIPAHQFLLLRFCRRPKPCAILSTPARPTFPFLSLGFCFESPRGEAFPATMSVRGTLALNRTRGHLSAIRWNASPLLAIADDLCYTFRGYR